MAAPLQILADQTRWLHRLAFSLVKDDEAARDLVQETVVRAIQTPKERRTWDRAWLVSILRNQVVDQSRKPKVYSLEDLGEVLDSRPSEELAVERHEASQLLGGAVSSLPNLHKRLIIYKYEKELTSTQIAALFGRTPRWVRMKLAEARAKLHIRLGRQLGENQWALAIAPLAIMGKRKATASAALSTPVLVPLLVAAVVALTGWAVLRSSTSAQTALDAPGLFAAQQAALESDPATVLEDRAPAGRQLNPAETHAAAPDPLPSVPVTLQINDEQWWGFRATVIEPDWSNDHGQIESVQAGDALEVPPGALLQLDRIPDWPGARLFLASAATMPALETSALEVVAAASIVHTYWTDGLGLEVQVSGRPGEAGRVELRVPVGSVEFKVYEKGMGVQPSAWRTVRTVTVLAGRTTTVHLD